VRVLISDIDGTLLKWRAAAPPGHVVIDRWADRVATMATREHTLLKALAHRDQLVFASRRSLAQFQRLEWALKAPHILVLDGGASIYIDGVRDRQWDERVDRAQSVSCGDAQVIQALRDCLPIAAVRAIKPGAATIICKLRRPLEASERAPLMWLASEASLHLWIDDRECGLENPYASKGAACRYLVDRLGLEIVASAGDSGQDESLVGLGVCTFAPAGSWLAKCGRPEVRAVRPGSIPYMLAIAG
jgi:hypothetical protein